MKDIKRIGVLMMALEKAMFANPRSICRINVQEMKVVSSAIFVILRIIWQIVVQIALKDTTMMNRYITPC